MRALTKIQNSIAMQSSGIASIHDRFSLIAKVALVTIATSMLASGAAMAADCNTNKMLSEGLGAVAGAAAGKSLVTGNQQKAAMVVGAVAGAMAGKSISENCENPQQRTYDEYEANNRQLRAQYERQQAYEAQLRQQAYEEQQRQLYLAQQRRMQEEQARVQTTQEVVCIPATSQNHSAMNTGTVLGTLAGAAVGKTLVTGNQQTTATIVGGVVGAIVGDNLNSKTDQANCRVVTRRVANPSYSQNTPVNQDYRVQNVSNSMSAMSSLEIAKVDAHVASTMMAKRMWETSLENLVNSSKRGVKDRKVLKELSDVEEVNRTSYVNSRDGLFETFQNISKVGERDIARYAPIIVALKQIPTEGVISVSALQAQEQSLRASPEYNRVYMNAKIAEQSTDLGQNMANNQIRSLSGSKVAY